MHEFTDAALDTLLGSRAEPDALVESRRASLKRHIELDEPIVDVEAWKNTSLKGFALENFRPATEVLTITGAEAIEAVGGYVGPLATALDRPAVAEAFERMAFADSEEFFTTLARAFHTDALVVYVPRNQAVAQQVVLERSIARAGDAIFPLTLVVTEESASVTVIERTDTTDAGGESLAVHATFVDAGPASQVTYLAVQDYAQDVWHFAPTRAVAGRDATVRTLTATMGARFSRSVTEAALAGRGSSAEMLGCYFGDHTQHVDHRTLQHHQAPNTTSDLYYKGALSGASSAVYAGLVKIDYEAVESDAQQKNRNLLLSNKATADASPFLEILTSEVQRATHGVSVGRPDAEVLFYLRSRGIEPDTAQRLFVQGFFQEVIDRVSVERVRTVLEDMIEAELDFEVGLDV